MAARTAPVGYYPTQLRGDQIRPGDLLGSAQVKVTKVTPLDVEGLSHCQNPPVPVSGDRCGCHSPAAKLRQLPRSLARLENGQTSILIHHLDHVAATRW